jgi:hypothetical protein
MSLNKKLIIFKSGITSGIFLVFFVGPQYESRYTQAWEVFAVNTLAAVVTRQDSITCPPSSCGMSSETPPPWRGVMAQGKNL